MNVRAVGNAPSHSVCGPPPLSSHTPAIFTDSAARASNRPDRAVQRLGRRHRIWIEEQRVVRARPRRTLIARRRESAIHLVAHDRQRQLERRTIVPRTLVSCAVCAAPHRSRRGRRRRTIRRSTHCRRPPPATRLHAAGGASANARRHSPSQGPEFQLTMTICSVGTSCTQTPSVYTVYIRYAQWPCGISRRPAAHVSPDHGPDPAADRRSATGRRATSCRRSGRSRRRSRSA